LDDRSWPKLARFDATRHLLGNATAAIIATQNGFATDYMEL
jgi:hypothetical protein